MKYDNMKRQDYLSWDDYFMSICLLSAQRSKDPNTQVGSCIVDENNHIISIGYNGFPNGCSDDKLPWTREEKEWLDNKYPYVVHAEVNAIMNKGITNSKELRMYVSLFPCNECTKLIIQSGIKEIIYLNDKPDDKSTIASKRMLDLVGIKYLKFDHNIEVMVKKN